MMNVSFNSGMPGFRVRRQKFGLSALLFLMLIGAIFTAAGVAVVKSSKIDPNWSKVDGRIVNSSSSISSGSTTYTAVVRYEVNGQSYQVTSGSGSSAYPQIGALRQVAYNPAQPNQAKVVNGAGTQAFVYIFPVVGIALLVFAPFAFIRSLRRNNDINHLMQNGQKLQGILVDVRTSGNTNNNAYTIVVSATDATGTVQNYVSDTLSGIGGLAMADFRNTPIPIDVYVNPANPNDYYVDVSDIPNVTPQRIADLLRMATATQSTSAAPTPFGAPVPPTAAYAPPNVEQSIIPPSNGPNFPPQAS